MFLSFLAIENLQKDSIYQFLYSISLLHVASKKKKGWVVDAHPLLIR